MQISIIVSVSENGVIGKNGKLPWNIPEDLQWFKKKTMGHFVLMGRKTFESIGKPLHGRNTVVITKNKNYRNPDVFVFNSIEKAIDFARINGETELFIAGGEEIYKQTIHIADRIYLTLIHKHYGGDSSFPKFETNRYKIISRKKIDTNPQVEFLIYERI